MAFCKKWSIGREEEEKKKNKTFFPKKKKEKKFSIKNILSEKLWKNYIYVLIEILFVR